MTTTDHQHGTDPEPDERGRAWRSKPAHLWTAFDRCEA